MSANIYENNGVASMAYFGQTPWHGMGQILDANDSPDTIRAKAGFDYELIAEPAGYMDASGTFRDVSNRIVLRRSDTGAPISIVGNNYRVHQPKQILDFFLDFSKTFGLSLETAGVLGRGERYWALARTSVDADLNGSGKDLAIMYALLATASDGSMVTRATPTAVRVVCANTWAMALNGTNTGSRQSHRSDFSNETAAEGLGFDLDASSVAFMDQIGEIKALNTIAIPEGMARGFFRTLLRPDTQDQVFTADDFMKAMGEDLKREIRGVDGLMDAYQNAPGARPGTARGLWEASTYFIDHVRGTDDESRMKSAVFGQGSQLKARAWANVRTLALAA